MEAWLAQVKNTSLEHIHKETCLLPQNLRGWAGASYDMFPYTTPGDPSVTGEVAEPV